MMQAIETKYLPATDKRASRIAAKCEAVRITLVWDYRLGVAGNHRAAAEALRDKLRLVAPHYGEMVGGSTSTGYAFVICDAKAEG